MLILKEPAIDEVNRFVNIPDIFEECRYEGCPTVLSMPQLPEIAYNGLYFDGHLVGLITLVNEEKGKEIHMSMLKGMRHLARKFVNSVLENEPLVYARIPLFKTSVINLAKKLGFVPADGERGTSGHPIVFVEQLEHEEKHLQMWAAGQTESAQLPGLSQCGYAQTSVRESNHCGSAEEKQRQVILKHLSPERRDKAGALQGLSELGIGDAPPELQSAAFNSVAVQKMPSGFSQGRDARLFRDGEHNPSVLEKEALEAWLFRKALELNLFIRDGIAYPRVELCRKL